MYNRDVQRAGNNGIRRIPDLLASHIFRDKWTRLNVKAARIMQQNHVIAELREYFESHRNDTRLRNTIQSRDACNKLFVRGLLSHEKPSMAQRNVTEKCKQGIGIFKQQAEITIEQENHLWEKDFLGSNNPQSLFDDICLG